MKIKLLYLPIVVENYEEDLRSTTKQVYDKLSYPFYDHSE